MTIIVIAIASAVPIVMHIWEPPADISTHGHLIDEQMSETMAEAGISFLAAQFILGFFIWKFSNRPKDDKIRNFPGRSRGLVAAAVILVGHRGAGSGNLWNQGLGQRSTSRRRPRMPCPSRPRPASLPSISAIPGPMGSSVRSIPNRSTKATENFFGLDPTHDPDSKDDIVTAELAIPVNREIHLLMHSKDVGHSFFVRELRIQQDFVPGLDLSVHFTATKIGKYEIVCTQLCGLGHYNMKAYLEVMSQEDFDKWLKQQAALQ